MQCKCGGEIKETSHRVKTIRGFKEWSDSEFKKENAPYLVTQRECDGCHRHAYMVEDCHDNIVCRKL